MKKKEQEKAGFLFRACAYIIDMFIIAFVASLLSMPFIDKDNTEKRPIMIHVSAIGTYERFVAILLEQSKGKLPL